MQVRTLAAAVLLDVLRRNDVGLISPFPVLILTVVYSAYVGWLLPALVSVAVTLVDALHYFAEPGRPLQYNAENGASLLAVGCSSLLTGLVVGLTNPKTIVFFVAVLPQFTDESSAAGPQIALLGLVFAAMAITSDSIWAVLAGKARDWFARDPRRLDRLGVAGGVMMIGLGGTMAATE